VRSVLLLLKALQQAMMPMAYAQKLLGPQVLQSSGFKRPRYAGTTFLQRMLDDTCARALQHVTYVDQSPSMVRRAQQLLQAHPALSTSVAVADEEFLPFASASHDRAPFFVAHHVSRRRRRRHAAASLFSRGGLHRSPDAIPRWSKSFV
jgi:hypothetical protein